MKYRIPLSIPTFGSSEIQEAIDSLTKGQVTMGAKVAHFEDLFADALGSRNAIMFNSGSSAALVSLALLLYGKSPKLSAGDEVVFPVVDWSTPVFAAIALGLKPVLVDVDIPTLNISPDAAVEATTEKCRAIVPTHMLGYPANMPLLQELAEEKSLTVIEDACEALGARIGRRWMGAFGDLGFFSFYFSHHITTIEGGMLITDDDDLADTSKAMREHGLSRRMQAHRDYEQENPNIDSRFLFAHLGFNLRPTEIQGAFGIHQLPQLESLIKARRDNARVLTKHLRTYEEFFILPTEERDYRHVYLGYAIILRDGCPFKRNDLVQFLEQSGIETRPIVAGNLADHPAMKQLPHRMGGKVPNAQKIMRDGFYFGIHSGIDAGLREYIASAFDDFIAQNV